MGQKTVDPNGYGPGDILNRLHLVIDSGTYGLDYTIKLRDKNEALFEKFKSENIPIMVGTQMVTKGLNFENVTLVGVISAEQSL